ncbi:MAG: hypothetical protein P8J87_02395 [Verrucomicrobiales bacterium]|nr:hypothetical protein [Verrucomicrobiales bacterium]
MSRETLPSWKSTGRKALKPPTWAVDCHTSFGEKRVRVTVWSGWPSRR